MTTWLDHVTDAGPVRAVFRDALPSLRGVNVHEVVLHRDGPRVELRLDLAEFPAAPPTKWTEFDTVQVRLVLVGVTAMSLRGWSTTVVTDLVLERAGEGLRLATDGGPVALEVEAGAATVTKISAYRGGEPERVR